MTDEKEGSQTFQINADDDVSRGRFSNSMVVSHGPEEFIIDWLLQSPNGVHLVSRIIVSPAHMKRIITALQENVDKYEESFHNVETIPTVVQ
jgi:hypothetical protein